MGKQAGLQTETKWAVETLPRPQRSQRSHSERAPCYSHYRRDPAKINWSYSLSIVDAKCDAKYWNVFLDKESSYLTTLNSPFGRYRFNRMPFGLKMSQNIFQTKIDQTFEGCEWQELRTNRGFRHNHRETTCMGC